MLNFHLCKLLKKHDAHFRISGSKLLHFFFRSIFFPLFNQIQRFFVFFFFLIICHAVVFVQLHFIERISCIIYHLKIPYKKKNVCIMTKSHLKHVFSKIQSKKKTRTFGDAMCVCQSLMFAA